jgi:Concanavalin A-like lectin/glucanases superfamily/Secretion system C-terminal sorting domain
MKRKLTLIFPKFLFLLLFCISFTTISNAQPGNALNFDGADDYVIIGPAGGLYAVASSYTKEAWVLYAGPNAFDAENIISSKDPLYIDQGHLRASNNFAGGANDVLDPITFPVNRWVHVALTYDAATTTMVLYRDGLVVNSNIAVGTASGSGQNYISGYDDGPITYNWKGNLDQVRVYNTALTQAQIQADMVSVTPAVPGSLVAYYNFDNGTAGGTNTGLTSLTDNSGGGNTGTLNNFALTGATSNWVESYGMVVPVAAAATGVGPNGFTANWAAPAVGVTNNYIVDVSTIDDFSAPVAGSPFTVAFGTNSLAVTGLALNTTYYYRVSSDKTSVTGTGAFSYTINLTTLAVLPVNLLSFSVSKTTGANLLQWSTATELNSKYFELLRSEDGINFIPVSKVYSNGNSSSVKNYQYADNLTSNLPPVYYYRLKMVDINGSYIYSDIVLVKNGKGITITVYPNPAQDKMIVNITDKNLLRTTASLSDISGKLLQTVNITQTVTTINISTYQKGVYILRLANGESVKLVKE